MPARQQRTPTEGWEFGFVLPNLVLPTDADDSNPGAFPEGISFAHHYITIAPGDHTAVHRLRATTPVVEQILGSFVNEHGRAYSPAVLLLRAEAPRALKHSLEAIVAFRNSIAMSVVLRGRAAIASGGGSQDVTWSDTFDFHPAQIGTRGRMILQSPAQLSWVSPTAALTLTHSPFVALQGRRLWPDHYLMWALGKSWRRRFTPQPKPFAFSERLFRSLESAFQACSVGAKNEASLHEYGTQIALWVSACEILAWPDRKRADIHAVLNLLDRYPGREQTRQKRFRAKVRGHTLRLSAPQRAYTYLYNARNAFLHGNPVSTNSMLTRSRSERQGLPRIAALVYRAALVAYLNQKYRTEISYRALGVRSIEMFDHHSFEQAFANVFGYEL
jgi:hypothetical protein